MALNCYPTCDFCKRDIMADDPPHQTRHEFERQVGEVTLVLKRRDLCDACTLRMKQVIMAHLPGCEWVLDGFEVERK